MERMADTRQSTWSSSRPVRVAARAVGLAARLLGQFPLLVASAGRLAERTLRSWDARPGARRRSLRRLAGVPLPNLYQVHPEARRATPREIGVRSVDVGEIVGTAVGGVTQRGSDFLPLPAFRSLNWSARWQRLLRATDNLAILPPVDLVRYDGKYWVTDGHNRIAAAHYVGQVEVDANITSPSSCPPARTPPSDRATSPPR